MGHDGPLYEIAQWYPRMAVYDDVKGWNHEPYIGAGEFYLEYGQLRRLAHRAPRLRRRRDRRAAQPRAGAHRDAARTSRAGAALGHRRRGHHARRSRRLSSPRLRAYGSGPFTWHFTATNVRDFAFAAAPNWMWDASGYDGILIQTLYRPSADKWANGEAHRMARDAIRHFSEQWYRYPYPHATTVEGPIEGMEYPMLTFVPNGSSRETTQWELAHEFGHEWFPMIVGSNERLYPWMDEGFNTFIDLDNAAAVLRRHRVRRHDRVEPAAPRAGAHAGGRAAADHQPHRGARPLLDGLPEARPHAAPAAQRGARPRSLRRRLPRLHPHVGVQAPDPGGLLPAHARRERHGARLVLARLGLHHRAARSGGRVGRHRHRRAARARTSSIAAR